MSSPPADAARDAKIYTLWKSGVAPSALRERFGMHRRGIEVAIQRARMREQEAEAKSHKEAHPQ